MSHRGSAAAVFDLDNTLVRGSSLFHFGRMMARERRLPLRHVARFALDEAMYVRRRRERAGLSQSVAACALSAVRGMEHQQLVADARRFAHTYLSRHLVHELHETALQFAEAGYATVIATASPQELATAVAERLGMTGAVGTRSEIVDGVYTGRLNGPVAHGYGKARRVGEMFGDLGIDPRRSWAFSDSVNDVPLLSMVGHAVAVDPDPELESIARASGWRIFRVREQQENAYADTLPLFPYAY